MPTAADEIRMNYARLLFVVLGLPPRYTRAIEGYMLESPSADEKSMRRFESRFRRDLVSQYPVSDALIQVMDEMLETIPSGPGIAIKYHLGLIDGIQRTYEEIATKMGVSRWKARELEMNGIRRLRYPERKGKILETLMYDLEEDLIPR